MTKVAILGGGFGGLRCALDLLHREDVHVTLIDRNSYHLFTPTLYEVASAAPLKGDNAFHLQLRRSISIPYTQIFASKKIDLIQAEIISVDLQSKHVLLDGGELLDFDYCVFALGSQTADYGISGVYEYAHQFKTVNDALALNQKVHQLFRALKEGILSAPLSFFIIGAGFTGIELAAELATCIRMMSHEAGLDKRAYSIKLFEAAPNVLPMIGDREREVITKRLTELGVSIMTNSVIESVTDDSIHLKTGHSFKGSLVVWTAGVQPNTLLKGIHNLPLTPKGKIVVQSDLSVAGQPSLFALGDLMEFIDPKTQKPVPALAYTAKAQGDVVAANILSSIQKKKSRNYVPRYDSWIAPVGGKFAVAHVGQQSFSGLLGWLIRGVADLRYFSSILPLREAFALTRRDLMLFTKNDG